MKKLFFICLCTVVSLLVTSFSYSQEVLLIGDSTSMVNVYGDIRLASAHQLPGVKPQKTYLTDGYRIVIYRGDVKADAQKTKSNFSKKHPQIEALIFFNSPTYYVRVGNFKTEEEAKSFLENIIKTYPDAVIIEDQIKITL